MGRYYVLDTARVCPPEDPIRHALLAFIPADPEDWIETQQAHADSLVCVCVWSSSD